MWYSIRYLFLFQVGLYANPIFSRNWPQVIMDRVNERSKLEKLPNSRLPEFTEEELEFISGTFDFLGFNTYLTRLVKDIDEYDYDDQPRFEKDKRVNISYDASWTVSSSGYSVSFYEFHNILEKICCKV